MLQVVWLMLLAVHTGAAAVWWWLMPGGFPSSSGAFWVNQVVPVVIVAMMLTALFARGRFGEALRPPVVAAILVFWMAFGIAARIVLFDSFRSTWNIAFLGGAGLGALWVRQFRARLRPVLLAAFVLPAGLAGAMFPGSQHAPEPGTRPAGGTVPSASESATDHKLVKLSKDAQLHPIDGRVVVRNDKLILNVQPLLSFADRSPDACWTALASAEESYKTTRSLQSKAHDAARWTLVFKDEDASVVDVTARDGAIELDARSRLARPLFSHLNTFAELTLQGHQKLTVAFSPAPQKRIEVPPATAPSRFAYVDESGTFHVIQAAQRQRGPFTEIASGRLGHDPLSLTFYDGDKAVFTVTLQDWAAQASTQLSPTAGDGVPVNVIELMRGGDAENTPALISFSLASTSIGRGTQSVGHAAGVYRNRITVKLP